MQELLAIVGDLSLDTPEQVVMVGNFNSSPDDVPGEAYHPLYEVWMPYTPPYMQVIQAGYLDAWLLQKRHNDGFTSEFDEFVNDPTAELTTRIDHIFLGPSDLAIEKVSAAVFGDEAKDMTPSGLWPSDHAGVVAKIRFSDKADRCHRQAPGQQNNKWKEKFPRFSALRFMLLPMDEHHYWLP